MHIEDLSPQERARQHVALCPLTPPLTVWLVRPTSETGAGHELRYTWDLFGPALAVALAVHIPGVCFDAPATPIGGPLDIADTVYFIPEEHDYPWVASRDVFIHEAEARAELARRREREAVREARAAQLAAAQGGALGFDDDDLPFPLADG